jgi:peptidoglycan/LPS O-acetylase OafA/YrhL
MSTTRPLRAVSNDISARPLEWNPPRQAISRVPYLPGLDGMRALAVVAVMVYHTNNGWLPGGFIGVEVFFVISGYLITLLLIGEHEKHGRIDLKQFWFRRARRLLPALFFMMTLLMVYTAIFKRDTLGLLRGDVIAGLGYITNWYQIWVGAGYTASADFAPLRHLWSLAVEEQFYLVWPLVMVALISLGRRRLPNISRWLLLAALLIALVMAVLYPTSVIGTPETHPNAYWDVGGRSVSKMDALYLSTITRSTGLLIGAAFAMLWRPVAVMRGPLRNKGRQLDLIALAGLAALGALAYYLHVIKDDGHADAFLFRGGFLAVGVATVMVMAAVTHKGAIAGPLLGNPVLNWIGTRSYGLYLFHWPIYQIIRETAGSKLTVTEFAGAMVVTAVITEFSYRFIEMPIRKQQLGRWWERIQETSDPKPRQLIVGSAVAIASIFGFAAVSMATAPLRQNDVRQALDENQDAVTDLGDLTATTTVPQAGTTLPPAPTTTLAGSPAAVATTAPAPTTVATTLPPANTRLIAIGDSVMLGAASPLKAMGFTVSAHESIQFSEVVPQVVNLMESGITPDLVVVALGTNGTIDDDDAAEMFGALSSVPHVIVLTLHVDRSWVPGNNELIQTLPGQFPNVTVLNWDALASGCVDWAKAQGMSGNCFGSDGFHLSADGADYYVELIRYTAVEQGVTVG